LNSIIEEELFEQTIKVDDTSLTYIGLTENPMAPPEQTLPRIFHNHAYAEIFFCRKDKLLVKHHAGEQLLSEGDILFVPPGIAHDTSGLWPENSAIGVVLNQRSCTDSHNAFKTLYALFTADAPVFFRRYDPVFPEEMPWMEELKTSGSIRPAISGYHALFKMAENYVSNMNPKLPNGLSNKNSNLMFQLEPIISTKYHENITAGQLAEKLYISPRQLARIVQERYNAPLHKVITNMRLESAAKLLTESNLLVEEISSAVGFSTKSCFYRAFRKEYHMTPIQYRKSGISSPKRQD